MITGGCSGLGWAIAQRCNKAQVTLLDVRSPPAAHNYRFVNHDVGNAAAWAKLADSCDRPDVLFLNAGTMSADSGSPAHMYRFSESTAESYTKTRAVNIDGVVFGLQALLPRMPPNSCIVVTVSLAGLHAYPFDPIYATTKHALIGLVRSLKDELLERDIRIHAFCPNRIATPLLPEATKTPEDLSPEVAAEAALSLVNETSSGFAWALHSSNEPLQRFPAKSQSVVRRVLNKLGRNP